MEHISQLSLRSMGASDMGVGMPGAKAANPYNEINQKGPLLPALTQAVWNSELYYEAFEQGDMNRKHYNIY